MAEIKPTLGAIESPVDLRNYKATCSAANEEFPEEFELYRPPVKDQGGVMSCVGFALSSLVEYFHYIQEGSYVRMSTDFIYGNRSGSTYTGQGMITSHALKNLTKFGDCPESVYKGNTEVPQAIQDFKDKGAYAIADAYPNRISSYFMLIGDNAIKANLMQNGIVIIAVSWYKNTRCVNGILEFHRDSGYEGGHCMFIYGWNKQGWLVGNSWGRVWGNKGDCIIPFGEDIREVYGVKDDIITDATKDKLIEELRAQITEFNTRNDELMEAIAKNTAEIYTLSNRVSELSIELFNLETENAKLGGEKEGLLKTIEELREEVSSTLAIIDDLKSQIDALTKQKEEYEAQIEDYKKTITQLKKELLEIKKPFNSGIGDFIAKILNAIINLFKKKEVNK